ncbi:MAG TPA: RhuM family protein [Ignavibacteria bacterium]|nr:RhuM family protein [Ignavibacteria bacterium]
MNSIEIYRDKESNIEVEVKFDEESVWLNQYQLSDLFSTDRTSVLKHLQNIYKTKELKKNETCAKFAQVQKEGKKLVKRKILFYNLDAIISVGYRVNSKKGVQFRKWATKRLKEFLIQGYTIDQKKLESQRERIEELKRTLEIILRIKESKYLEATEASGLIDIISQYSFALDTLDEYDYQKVTVPKLNNRKIKQITYTQCMSIIKQLKSKFSKSRIFGVEKDSSFKSSIMTIFQTFDKKELYPSIEEKSSMLLYLIIKNHSFIDGNKRIAASIFLWFLAINSSLFNNNGSKRITDNELVALCLMIASSNPKEKELIIKVIIKLLTKN